MMRFLPLVLTMAEYVFLHSTKHCIVRGGTKRASDLHMEGSRGVHSHP
jgi:hypothetical protein